MFFTILKWYLIIELVIIIWLILYFFNIVPLFPKIKRLVRKIKIKHKRNKRAKLNQKTDNSLKKDAENMQ